jgi:hypothetical protein
MTHAHDEEPKTFVLFSVADRVRITTAHKDGSIPLNSQWVIDHLEKADLNQDMLAQLLRRANTQPDLLEALEYLTTHTPERHNEGPSLIPNPDWAAWVHKARAAIIKATV